MRKILLSALVVLLMAGLPAVALAAWSTSSTVNNPICTAASDQWEPQLVSDGAGGAIITWTDYRNSTNNWDIYVQRVDSGGNALWTANGTAISTAANVQTNPQIVSDGAGGAIITWQSYNLTTEYDIYAQWVNASGDTQWTANGTAICTAANRQDYPQIVSDGAGGAVITWTDYRFGAGDIYAQRVDSDGNALWTANGTDICSAGGGQTTQELPQIASDGAGGAVITWTDNRHQQDDIYAQRVDSGGNTQWTANGTAICTEGTTQDYPQIVSDGAHGAIITWRDYRSSNHDIYAQLVDSGGNTQWTANGTAICTMTSAQEDPQLVSDGAGGAVITWEDHRSVTDWDIYAQQVNSGGSTQWTANGTAISTADYNQSKVQLVSDGAGGAVITWRDYRSNSDDDIYAQRVDSSGSTLWKTDGTAISTAVNDQTSPQIVSDGAGGAVITWMDFRNSSVPNCDIYAQQVDASGTLGSPTWPANNPISTEGYDQEDPELVSDGAGGAIITWEDYRSGSGEGDIYAQRMDSSCSTLWATNGIAICNAANDQWDQELVSDGAGGAIIAWVDERHAVGSDNYSIYVQRVDSSGSTLWTDNGTAICNEIGEGYLGGLVSDNAGGAIIVWEDWRGRDYDIYAQRVDSSGDTLWTDNGTAICTETGEQWSPKLVSDNAGGAIIAWEDLRGADCDIYAQRVDSSGSTLWTNNGTVICNETDYQHTARLVSDGAGGAVITWMDFRGDCDIYAQRVDSSGSTLWTNNGTVICNETDYQHGASLASDGASGAIIAWSDERSDDGDIYVQRVDSSGSTLWTANGTAISTAADEQSDTELVSDGAGGAIIVWEDERSDEDDIYAQRVDLNGNAQWTTDGIAISTAADRQQDPRLIPDGAGGALIVWEDERSGDEDIYAQRVYSSGVLCSPAPPSVGGGSVGGASPPSGSNWIYEYTTPDGEFTEGVSLDSPDGKVELDIPEGTVGLTEDGDRLLDITIEGMDDPPDPPEESHRIGLTYDFGPDGASFDPPAELTFKYDPDDIPEGVDEENLVVAMWDEEAGEWVDLECTVDPETNTITAKVSHFSAFGVVAYTSPAAFEITYLSVQPTEVDAGEDVAIKAEVTNSGDLSGSYDVALTIDGKKVDTGKVTLAGGEKDTVSFTVSQDAAGTYRVEVNGWSHSFTVAVAPLLPPTPGAPAPAAPPTPVPPSAPAGGGGVNWYIAGTVLGVTALLTILLLSWTKKRRAG